ncbi:cellulose-binding protein [Saccharothrix sp. NRRL B-16348]|uniref:cellulose binding domain-containing protein n=1 Tax=Saccharothrix sp. NRRL B-16348 TaxID=1415542 RepID=UPI0006AE97D9|nr:cellulose binding domain-containing protein [Saccharothrix sp. NRRL B-16348]KOX19880.1 cellulose-binding protein [Saccharothrix sp. NRRL B-16348]
MLSIGKVRPAVVVAVTALVAAAAITTTVPAQAAAGCRVTYKVTNQWWGGFGADVSVTNLGDPITSWRLTWSFAAGQTIGQHWNAKVGQSGAQVTADNVSWNGALGTGASAGFGFNSTWNNASNPVPTNFAVNGTVCTGSVGPTTTTTTTSTPSPDVLAGAHTAGRVKATASAAQYTWPGVYFEGRFRGTGVGVVLNDANNDYEVQVDGTTVATLLAPGRTTHWVNNLTNAEHSVRLVKRTESTWAAGEFGGFVAATGGEILAKPAARTRQIEFIGDSNTVGYGNTAGTRDCSTNGGVSRNTNANLNFGALTARSLNADYQINAQSGLGMVRNYNGGSPELDYRTFYERGLQHVAGDVWQNPGTWKPQLVVVALGTNDFSTAINPGERWTTPESLVAAYKTAYQGFLDKLRARYGANTVIVVGALNWSSTPAFAQAAEQVVKDRNSQGDSRVRYWYYEDPSFDRLGCDWHFSLRDHRTISGLLNNYIAALPLAW